MRIIAGSARGTKLYTLDGDATRPTLDRVKEPLFSIIQLHVPDAFVLDLFAGSGALSLEALSRGARKAVLCDNSRNAINIIKQNIEKTRFTEETELLNLDYEKALEKFKMQNLQFDLVFLDPPYKKNYLIKSINAIIDYNLLTNDGIIVAETDEELVLEEIKGNIYDTRQYGRVKLIFIKK